MPLSIPETRQLYRALASHFPHGTIAVYDRDLRYIVIDGQLTRTFMPDPEDLTGEIVGHNIEDEQTRLELQNHARCVFDGEQFHIEMERAGSYYKLDFVPVKINDEVRYGLIVVQDLTADIALKRNLASAIAEAKEALAVRDKFLAVAAHELKTPLTTIMGFTQLLAHRIKDRMDDREQRMLQVALVQQARLNSMINALLDFSRLERGTLALNTAPLDVVLLTREVVSEMRVVSDNHTFIEEYVKSSTIIDGDHDRLEQVVRNVLMNAIKYSPNGGTIHVTVRRLMDQVTLTITDTGLGIPPQDISRIFDQFTRGSNLTGTTNTQISGMGIGLHVSREIVHLHGGAIYAASEGVGHGSSFTIVLPLKKLRELAPQGASAI